jgi:type VI secretion system secreted protein Hcp
MAFDAFLKLDGIPGESRDSKHKDEIDLISFSWGESRASSLNGGGGAATGRVSFQDFHFTHRVDKASTQLFLHCANGAHIKDATITCRKAGETPVEFLVYKLTDVLVSSCNDSGAPGAEDTPLETISLNFAQIEVSFTPQDQRGAPGEPLRAGWNIKQHKKV